MPFFWFEAYVNDPAEAARRLAVVPGWSFEARPGAVPSVTIRAGDTPVGAVLPIPPDAEAEPHWVAHVAVDDVGALCRRVAFVQGTVLLEPTELEGVGTTALVEDPSGTVFAPFAARAPRPPPAVVPGALPFATLLAPRRDLAARVYRTLLDWREASTVDTEAGRLALVRAGEVVVGALLDPGEVAGPQWTPHVVVADVDALEATLDAIEADDGDVLLPATDLPGVGTVALALLADGLPLGLLAPSAG